MGLLSFKKNKNKKNIKVKAKANIATGIVKAVQKQPPLSTNNTASTANSTASKIPSDVPVNINVQQQKDRRTRGLSRATQQWSTFSLVSMPSMKRGISERLENPYLWDYDNEDDIYANYDVNEEIQEDDTGSSNGSEEFSYVDRHNTNNGNNPSVVEEESFFAANPLPGLSSSNNKKKKDTDIVVAPRRASAPAMVTELPVGDPTFSTPAVTRALVKQYISEIWNRAELHLIPLVCSPKIRFNSINDSFDKVGHEGFARMVETIHASIQDYHCEVHSMVVEGNKAFCRLRFSGKHVGSLMGYPPTGQRVSWMGSQEFTCVNGTILKVWELADMLSLKEQLQAHAMHEALGGGPQHEDDDRHY